MWYDSDILKNAQSATHTEVDGQVSLRMEKCSHKKFEPNLGERNAVEKWWQFIVGSIWSWNWEGGWGGNVL